MASVTEQTDHTPAGKVMEAIIESVDEFQSENLAQEVTRGMREGSVQRLPGLHVIEKARLGHMTHRDTDRRLRRRLTYLVCCALLFMA